MKNILQLIFLLLPLSSFLQAQTLEEYQEQAGQQNPLLKARYAEYQAALERVPQVGSLPDPEASFNFFLKPMERYMGKQVGDVSVMQMFPWFGSLSAAKTEANYMAQMKFATFMEAKLNLYTEVHSSWIQLYRIDKEAALLAKELEILKAMERIALAKYAAPPATTASPARPRTSAGSTGATGGSTAAGGGMAGMGGGNSAPTAGSAGAGMSSGSAMAPMGGSGGSMVDVILIRVQVKELENRLHLLRASRRPQEVAFNNMLFREAGAPVQVADTLTAAPLPASLTLIQDSIRQNHPMLKMYEWDEKAREAQLQMARLMGRPMLGIGLNYMVFQPRMDEMTQMPMGGENMLMPMVTVTLPVYRKKYAAQRKEAAYAQQAAVYQKQATERQLFTQLENLLYDYQNAASTLSLLQDQIQLNEQAIRLLTSSYSLGNTGIEEILRQRQVTLSYRQQQLQSVVNQHIAAYSINLLMNSQLYTGTYDTSK